MAWSDGSDPRFLRRWISYVVVGETVGFLVAASGMAAGNLLAMSPWAAWATAVVAGLGEGALLGTAQALALRRSGVAIRARAWVLATSAAAALAWGIGMLPATLPGLDWTSPLTWAGAVVGGALLLLSIPTAQAPLLRGHVPHPWRWVPLNVAAWGVGILWTFAPSPFINETTPPGALFLAYGVAGMLMAVTVAVVTGFGLRRMLRQAAVSPLSAGTAGPGPFGTASTGA